MVTGQLTTEDPKVKEALKEKANVLGQHTCKEVYNSKEFKALAKLLGIDLTKQTYLLAIIISGMDQPVRIEHHYLAADPDTNV